jgi:ATP phosphoribosyltransferase regulatory subunit
MLNGYNYYTGVIFRGYTYGTGDAVVKGGRYNNLLKQFGKDAPSIGFAFTVEELIMALSRQNIEVSVEYSNTIILYDIENQESAISLGKSLRQNDKKIELIRKSVRKSVEDYLEYAKREHFSGLFYFENSDTVKVFDLVSGDENEVAIASLK